MSENQIVNIDLGSDFEDGVEKRTAINTIITNQIKKLGKGKSISDLDLSFSISDHWPISEEIDLSTLVVLAYKLKLKITIRDIELKPC